MILAVGYKSHEFLKTLMVRWTKTNVHQFPLSKPRSCLQLIEVRLAIGRRWKLLHSTRSWKAYFGEKNRLGKFLQSPFSKTERFFYSHSFLSFIFHFNERNDHHAACWQENDHHCPWFCGSFVISMLKLLWCVPYVRNNLSLGLKMRLHSRLNCSLTRHPPTVVLAKHGILTSRRCIAFKWIHVDHSWPLSASGNALSKGQ